MASGAATVQLSLRKHIRLGKSDPEEIVSLGEPVTLDLSSSEPQQVCRRQHPGHRSMCCNKACSGALCCSAALSRARVH